MAKRSNSIAASAAPSDDDLIAKVTEMSPESFEKFLIPTNLQALVEMASGAVPPDAGLIPPPNEPLPPAKKYRESSEPDMLGAWSASEDRLLSFAVEQMKRQSPNIPLDWESIRLSHLPFRTATAIERRFCDNVRQKRAKSDDADEECHRRMMILFVI